MHRVLCIAEILCLICDGVDGAALATLAQCCTTFHGPAIQVYWRSIPDFIPLVRCFPADAVRFKDTDGLVSLVRRLEPEDWVAFIKYSKLVRHIGTREGTLWNIPDNVKLDDQFLRQLGESASRRMLALLPNLLSFDWAGCRLPPSDLSRTLCLLGTQVETVRITDWHEEKGPLVEALLLLGHYFPQLRVLELRRSHPDMPEGGEEEMWFMYGVGLNPNSKPYVPYSPLTLPGAYRLRVLTRLDCSAIPITETTFQALCQLPMLTSLSIHLPKPLAWPGMNNSSEAFQKLKELTITAAALKDYCAFSALILFSQVETLHLRIARTTLRKNDIPRIFSAIKRQYSPTTLTTLSVCTSKLTPTPAVRRPVAWVYEDDIQQLFYFNNLVAFELGLNCSYNLGGYIYSELVHAWPRLERLSIGNNRYARHHHPASIQEALLPFVHHSPNLTQLEVTFDGECELTPEEVANMLPNRRRSPSRVTSFSSIHSPINEPHVMAAILVRLFPDLKQLGHDDSRMWSEPWWGSVPDYIPWFSMTQNIGPGRAP